MFDADQRLKLDWGSIRSSPGYELSPPDKLSISNTDDVLLEDNPNPSSYFPPDFLGKVKGTY